MQNDYTCTQCGYEYPLKLGECPLCNGHWQGWELLFAPLPLGDLRAQVMGWMGQLPFPSVLEWSASPMGLRVRLYAPPHTAEGVVQAWAAMTGQHSRWRKLENVDLAQSGVFLRPDMKLPSLTASAPDSDPLLAIGSRLIQAAREGGDAHMRLWILGKEGALQEKLRALSAYSYGTEGGVENNTPNPWGMRLAILRAGLILGLLVAGISAGAWNAGWLSPLAGLLGTVGWRDCDSGFRLGHGGLAGMALDPQGCARTPHPGTAPECRHLPVSPAEPALARRGADLVSR